MSAESFREAIKSPLYLDSYRIFDRRDKVIERLRQSVTSMKRISRESGRSCFLLLLFQITPLNFLRLIEKGSMKSRLDLFSYRRLSPLCRRAGCARSYIHVTCIMQNTCLWVRARRHVNVMFKHKSHA